MDDPPARGIKDEVEGGGQGKEDDEVEKFVGLLRNVWLGGGRGGWERRVWKEAQR